MSFTATGVDELVARFQAAPGALRENVRAAVVSETDLLRRAVLGRMALLFKNAGGKMRETLSTDVADSGTAITGTVTASGLPYLAIQEFGGVTSPHDILPVSANVLAFMGSSGDMVFARRVHHPGSRIPERSYMRAALAERRIAIMVAIQAATATAFGQAA